MAWAYPTFPLEDGEFAWPTSPKRVITDRFCHTVTGNGTMGHTLFMAKCPDVSRKRVASLLLWRCVLLHMCPSPCILLSSVRIFGSDQSADANKSTRSTHINHNHLPFELLDTGLPDFIDTFELILVVDGALLLFPGRERRNPGMCTTLGGTHPAKPSRYPHRDLHV